MGADSKIEWTTHTFNPWIGCTAVSPACDNCYAKALVNGRMGGNFDERRPTSDAYWKQPLTWNRKAAAAGRRDRVFCASLADVFDNQVPAEWRHKLWELIEATPHLDWLLLTKRPQNIRWMLPAADSLARHYRPGREGWPWPNVWLGTTVENQSEASRRIPHLLAAPAAKHFLSCEPLLGPVDLGTLDIGNGIHLDAMTGYHSASIMVAAGLVESQAAIAALPILPVPKPAIGWVIAGGESGPQARPTHPDWLRGLRDQCQAAGVPFFFKQWGEWTPGENITRRSGCVDTATWFDQKWWPDRENLACDNGHVDDEPDLYRVGKKAAGARLDGAEHREVPHA